MWKFFNLVKLPKIQCKNLNSFSLKVTLMIAYLKELYREFYIVQLMRLAHLVTFQKSKTFFTLPTFISFTLYIFCSALSRLPHQINILYVWSSSSSSQCVNLGGSLYSYKKRFVRLSSRWSWVGGRDRVILLGNTNTLL